VEFDHVDPAAQPFLATLLAAGRSSPAWVVCPDVRTQEDLANEAAAFESVGVSILPELLAPKIGDEWLPDPEVAAERLDLLHRVAAGKVSGIITITARMLEEEVPDVRGGKAAMLDLRKGQRRELGEVVGHLSGAGFERVPQITSRGQFAVRGGILDLFGWQHPLPLRAEWSDDEIESLREFDLDRQTTVRALGRAEVLIGDTDRKFVPLAAYFAPDSLLVSIGGAGLEVAAVTIQSGGEGDHDSAFYGAGLGLLGAGDIVLREAAKTRLFAQIAEWGSLGWSVVIFCNNEGELERFREIAAAGGIDPSSFTGSLGRITRGFTLPSAKLAVLSDAEIFGRSGSQRARRQLQRTERMRAARSATDFGEFREGDLVVHTEHGIGRYLGLQKMGADPEGRDVLTIAFAAEARLYVPLEQAWQVSRYVGVGRKAPALSTLGDESWQKARQKAQRSVFDYAKKLLSLQAERETGSGFAFPEDNHWQREFEGSFLFKETDDQLRAIEEAKRDMESPRPMDRLVCGDVGFGKTEVAIRAAFKAVMGGKQVAFLAPTTVLAQQHYQTFRERMSDYPVTIGLLNRYRTPAQQRELLKSLAAGETDIVIGTHRLISGDVVFKDLGLVVIDEEQRFGVRHKDRFKELFSRVDVLTLSATPIPRTLYMALMGARHLSLIETPPPNRKPVETIICGYDERLIRDAIDREMERGGQVYLLHNRIRTIDKLAGRIRGLCPSARVVVGHGQMGDDELESVMGSFISGAADVLVSTTIIESGLDIPNANTIVIDRADLFGLADLYQLRGRVGRAGQKAYAYLMLPRDLLSVGESKKRISAIKQYSELGAGFKIAMRDLEIRGAGNLLGTAQSGHIIAVGFDLYCKLLRRAVDTLSSGKRFQPLDAGVRLDFLQTEESAPKDKDRAPAFLPEGYITGAPQRIEAYRKVAEAEDAPALDAIAAEWADRYGPVPPAAHHFLAIARIRISAAHRGVSLVEVRKRKLMLTRHGDYLLIGGKFPRLTARNFAGLLKETLDFLETLRPI